MELKRKLMSRKLWVALIGIVSGIAALFGADDGIVRQIGAYALVLGSCIAYILGEAWLDAANTIDPDIEIDLSPLIEALSAGKDEPAQSQG